MVEFLADMIAVTFGFLLSNLILGVWVLIRIRAAKRKGLKRLKEAEARMKEMFPDGFGDSDEEVELVTGLLSGSEETESEDSG